MTATLIERLNKAIELFLSKESTLLMQDAHEEAISASLISYLKSEFDDFKYHIDSQYDKRIIDSELYRKHTDFLIERLPKSKIPKKCYKGQKVVKKEILPDIIFHDRDSSGHNFLVIEIKKSKNQNKDDRDFDLLKLQVMTSLDFYYDFGIFIDFFTGDDFRPDNPYTLKIVKNGKLLS